MRSSRRRLIGSIVITLGIVLAAVVVRHAGDRAARAQEAEAFWQALRADPDAPAAEQSSTMTGYLVPRGRLRVRRCRTSCAALAPGLHALARAAGRWCYVERRPQGTLYLVFSAWMADQSVLLTGLVSLLLSLLTSGVLIWLTYRTSKRLVTPVSWLANQVDAVGSARSRRQRDRARHACRPTPAARCASCRAR